MTQNLVLDWAASGTYSGKTMGRRIEVIRPFSKYVHSFVPDTEIIQSLIYKNVHERPTPYIYSENEVLQLMNECKTLYLPDIRAYTVETVIGLLWSTELRPTEPIKLTIADVNLEQQLLHIETPSFSCYCSGNNATIIYCRESFMPECVLNSFHPSARPTLRYKCWQTIIDGGHIYENS